MKKTLRPTGWLFFALQVVMAFSCGQANKAPSKEIVNEIELKRGPIISCGLADEQFGSVAFETSCDKKGKEDFNRGLKLLHSFEYDEAEKAFAKIIDENAGCAMAYWGVAMSNFHPLWAPPSQPELVKGAKAIEIAKSIQQKSDKEEDYINALSAFYSDWDKLDHKTRSLNFEKAMENLHLKYPNDTEASTLYALALTASANPSDTLFTNQKKAGSILMAMYPKQPNHPGIVHYIIHTYDYPGLAALALPAARSYASVAPSSAHALHMPSHIFTRLGFWEECVRSNIASVASAKCYAEQAGIKGNWDEEIHGLDYLIYAYLQQGNNNLALQQLNYLKAMHEVHPVNFKVAYAFAAMPARYVLENRRWKEAAILRTDNKIIPWKDYPWQQSIVNFTRLLGCVHTGDIPAAQNELDTLRLLDKMLVAQKDAYKSNQVQIMIHSGEAWIQYAKGDHDKAERLMSTAAAMEDMTQKHPVTPGEVIPARELLADMLLQMNQPLKALHAYEEDLKKHPNRFNGLYGAAVCAEKLGQAEKAMNYYRQLIAIATPGASNREELKRSNEFVKKHS